MPYFKICLIKIYLKSFENLYLFSLLKHLNDVLVSFLKVSTLTGTSHSSLPSTYPTLQR